MAFTPRTSAPSSTDKNWIQVSYGGYNKCINISKGSVLPNCVGYAWGRFREILGKSPKLSTSHAYKWYGNTSDGYSRNKNTPQLGAVICWSGGSYGHVAVVEKIYSDRSILISESSYGDFRFGTRRIYAPYSYGNKTLQGFIYNPAVTSSIISGDDRSADDVTDINNPTFGPLYDSENTREDAIVREVAYINNNTNQPSINTSNIKLSVINYTSLLSSIFDIVRGSQYGGGDQVFNTDKLDSKPREIVEYLTNKGLSTAAAVGIIANMHYETVPEGSFNTASVGDHGTSFGICQWHNNRGTAMKNMAGSNWKNNLTGQLNYLWYELNHGYSGVLSSLKKVQNTEAGARQAADIFVRRFEIPANVNVQSQIRQNKASDYWKLLVPQLI